VQNRVYSRAEDQTVRGIQPLWPYLYPARGIRVQHAVEPALPGHSHGPLEGVTPKAARG